ncbi:hypothetical protein ACFXOL_20940 [Streptomyces californicus]|uniref:hypothetical protein n=1 Tax=Streptomyces californicus TaxID=67351 RepID=UPI00364CAE80
MLVNEQATAKTRWRPVSVPLMLEEEAIGMGKNSGKSSGARARRTSMTPQAASRVQSAGAKNPGGGPRSPVSRPVRSPPRRRARAPPGSDARPAVPAGTPPQT